MKNRDSTSPVLVTDVERQKSIDSLSKIISENETALLLTVGNDHVIRSRPMVNINEHFEGELYFVSERDSEVCSVLAENPKCNISIAEPASGNFASITGQADIEDNAQRLELMWNDECRKWFDSEEPHPDLRLIKVDVDDAEIWDRNQSLSSRIGSMVSGSSQSIRHSKVDWTKSQSANSDQPKDTKSEASPPTLSLMAHHSGSDSQ